MVVKSPRGDCIDPDLMFYADSSTAELNGGEEEVVIFVNSELNRYYLTNRQTEWWYNDDEDDDEDGWRPQMYQHTHT